MLTTNDQFQLLNMNKIIFFIITAFTVSSCSNNTETPETQGTPKVQVKITHIIHGILPDYLQLTGKTVFMNKSTTTSPIAGYVTKVNIQPGDYTVKGDTLFMLIAQEIYALKDNDSLSGNYKSIPVLAPTTGIVNKLTVSKKPVFVDKNAPLCNIVETSSFFIETEVPYEYTNIVKIGNSCKIQFPDSMSADAVFYKVMPTMNQISQTQKVLAKIRNIKKFIPENMIVTVLVEKSKTTETQILPKPCVITDALMTKYWVMKLINDSIAVQIPVKIGKQTHSQVEILSPAFNLTDKIISEGAYGLGDTALVEIIK